MAKYQMYFDTTAGLVPYTVNIGEHETLDKVLPDILIDLQEEGYVLDGQGEVCVTWTNIELDLSRPLPEQGVKLNDILRVSLCEEGIWWPRIRRGNDVVDVTARAELHSGDDIMVGSTILGFRVGQQQKSVNKQATIMQRLQEGQSFKQTVYYMTLVGGIAGLCCWALTQVLAFALSIRGGLATTVIDFGTLGGFIGGLSIAYNDKWLGDRVVGTWVLTGALTGAAAGALGGLLSQPILSALAGQYPMVWLSLAWMITGALIGFGISLRWFSVNRNRVAHGLLGGLLGGLVGGAVYWSAGLFISHNVSRALGFILTGACITLGISLAPILLRKAVLEFLTSGDPQVLDKYLGSRKKWEIHHGGKYVIGSLTASHTRAILGPEVQVYIPDEMVAAPRRAGVEGRQVFP